MIVLLDIEDRRISTHDGIGPSAWGQMLLPFAIAVNNSRPLQWYSDLQIPVYF